MSDYDLFTTYEPEQPATLEEERQPAPPRAQGPGCTIYSVLTAVFLLATVGFIIWAILVINDPVASYNPFPPPSPAPTSTAFILDTGAAFATIPPSWTPSPTITAGPTATRQATPTETLTPGPTATGITPPPGATNTIAVFPFTLQDEAVTYARNANGQGCAWSSIAGQVLDMNGGPLPDMVIQVTGENFQQIAWSGAERRFGASGYEVLLNTTPTEAEFVVQLMMQTGMPLSEPVVVRTLSSCERNVAVVNFVQNHPYSR